MFGIYRSQLFKLLHFNLVQVDNEENVLVCLRIIIELHKQYRPPICPEVQQFLQFVKNIYKELPNHLNKIFEPQSPVKVKDISEINVEAMLTDTFTLTTIMTEKKNQENQPVSVSNTKALFLYSLKVLVTAIDTLGHF